MRLKSSLWVSAYLRRCQIENAFAVVRRRGAEDGGTIYIKVSLLDGTARLYAPAPQTSYGEADGTGGTERLFAPAFENRAVAEADVDNRMRREIDFDPDLWWIEIEDKAGRHFLDLAPDDGARSRSAF